jgi:NAD(P)-dependent dehydrogenase (short-subunit alcohol dehydrogenase family)
MAEFARRVDRISGRIVNISSGQARTAMPGAGMYAGSKGAIEAITRVFAADLGSHGITVNAVAPGATATKQFLAAVSEPIQYVEKDDASDVRLLPVLLGSRAKQNVRQQMIDYIKLRNVDK